MSNSQLIGGDKEDGWGVAHWICPTFGRIIIHLRGLLLRPINGGAPTLMPVETILAFPRTSSRPIPTEVPNPFAEDYREAALVLSDSPKASAALAVGAFSMCCAKKLACATLI
jgi:hypothetical protein